MSWLTGSASSVPEVVAKAVFIYLTAVIVLRLGERRTIAQWTIIDFATAVAMGAIIGRTAIAADQSYLTGAVAIVTLALSHRAASLLRLTRPGRRALDHGIRVLVADGVVRDDELRRCGLTVDDLAAQLRQRGTFSVEQLRYVLYEARGDLTIVPSGVDGHSALVTRALDEAVNFPDGTAT
jgi:uncharacterized membrane protein YcaP (DUF421 family)